MKPIVGAKVLKELQKDPFRTCYEIAEAAGCTVAYVARIAKKHNILYGRPLQTSIQLSKENLDWLHQQEAALGISFAAVVNACITDARLDNQGNQA